jgi:hypothetical protein
VVPVVPVPPVPLPWMLPLTSPLGSPVTLDAEACPLALPLGESNLTPEHPIAATAAAQRLKRNVVNVLTMISPVLLFQLA